MPNRNGEKGRRFESACVEYLIDAPFSFPHMERRTMKGSKDVGDLIGAPGITWSCKDVGAIRLPQFTDELEEQRERDGADVGILVVKRRLKPIRAAYAVTSFETMKYLLKSTGY